MLAPLKAIALVALIAAAVTASAKEYKAAGAADVAALADRLQPGDVVVMANGVWTNQAVVLHANGTEKKPVTLRAQTPGKVVLTGDSSLTLDGDYLVASGLQVHDGKVTNDGLRLAGNHGRITDSAVVGGAYKSFVRLVGTDNRIDHCYLAEKTSNQPTL